ncbi:hypothetical protein [Pseudophaeobacter sp.]|uniref:hypothetical protein n=1 Tax=Pseudophaeobacter sp. TaxID=1971739 RepID=UPI0040584324
MKFASQQSHGHFLHRFGFAETGLTTSGSIISWATAGTRSIVTSQRSRTAVWAPEQPVLLHPALSQMYKKKVADLTAVLNDPETKAKATTIIRSMLSEIRLSPIEGALEIELVGELTGLLTLGQKETASKRYASGRWLCCTNPCRDSLHESSMIAGRHEQLAPHKVQNHELVGLQ